MKKIPGLEPEPPATTKPLPALPKTENESSQCVLWLGNSHWTDCLVAFIVENTNIHLKLFGDSTKLAASEDRPKVCKIYSSASTYN
jgi:hypothetical protein